MGRYDDIIGLPHHVSENRPHLTMAQRAAQFSPFAALTGFGDEVREAGRFTSAAAEPDETEKEEIDRVLRRLTPGSAAVFTFFVPDDRKDGGEYREAEGTIKRVDPVRRVILLEDGREIPIDRLTGAEEKKV